MKESILTINDIRISYYDSGKGETTIIFIHGFPFDKSSWDFQLEALKDSFRVIAYDIRGFGHSSSGEREFSIDLFADDLISIMDALKINNAVICGLSMGGYIALNAVSRFPQRFRKLILSDTQCSDDSPEAKEKRYKTIELLNNGGLKQWVTAFEKSLFIESTFEKKENDVKNVRSVMMTNPVFTLVSSLKALAERRETCSILSKITIPTLILCGESDSITPPAKSQQLNKDIKSSVLKIIPDAGHLSNIEQPGIFNKYLSEFVQEGI